MTATRMEVDFTTADSLFNFSVTTGGGALGRVGTALAALPYVWEQGGYNMTIGAPSVNRTYVAGRGTTGNEAADKRLTPAFSSAL